MIADDRVDAACRLLLSGSNRRGGSAPDDIFRDHFREQKIQEVVGSAGFGSAAGHSKAAEGMAPNERTGDSAIDVEITDPEFRFDALNCAAGSGEKKPPASAYGVPLAICSAASRS